MQKVVKEGPGINVWKHFFVFKSYGHFGELGGEGQPNNFSLTPLNRQSMLITFAVKLKAIKNNKVKTSNGNKPKTVI